MKYLNNFKKLATLLVVLGFTLFLLACKNVKTPYGSVNSDVYANVGDLKVTKKELYESFRKQGNTILSNMIDRIVFETQINEATALVKAGDKDSVTFFNEKLNSAIHSQTDQKVLLDLLKDHPDLFYRNIEKFVDNLYLVNNSIFGNAQLSDVALQIYSAAVTGSDAANEDDRVIGYEDVSPIGEVNIFNILLDTYVTSIAQRIYAKGKLVDPNDGDIFNDESTSYINQENDKDLVSYYETSDKGKYDVKAFIIDFINLNEANAALQLVGIKSDSRGYWYHLPDIRTMTEEQFNSQGYGHVAKILEELKLTPDFDSSINNGFSLTDYENYYNKYTISVSRTDGANSDVKLETAAVKDYFIRIANELDKTQKLGLDENGVIRYITNTGSGDEFGDAYEVDYTYEELTKLNTTIRDHIYKTLISEDFVPKVPEEGEEEEEITGTPYSSRLQTAGNIRYLAFKLHDEESTEDGILVDSKNSDDEDIKIFGTSEKAKEARQKALDEIIKAKLTTSYITDKVTAFYTDNVTIDIFDSVVREFFANTYDYTGKNNKPKDNDTLAIIKVKDGSRTITVDEFYVEMERSYGLNIALDLLTNKFLASSASPYKVTDDERKDFKSQFDSLIGSFSSDSYASSGYPASMGREKFLLLAFGATTTEEAIETLYVYPKLRDLYLADYESQYGSNDGVGESIYDKFAEIAGKQSINFKSLSTSHLLIYFDKNNDGTPDNPEEFLNGLTDDRRLEVEKGLVEFVEYLIDNANDYVTVTQGFTKLATDFQTVGRIVRGSKTKPIEYTLEQTWSRFRQLGFNLKFESLPSAITNTSNLPTGSSTLDIVYYNAAMAIYSDLTTLVEGEDGKDKKPEYELPYAPILDDIVFSFDHDTGAIDQVKFEEHFQENLDTLNNVKSTFGYHLIFATQFSEATSAEYTESEDSDGVYENSEGLNAYNEKSKILTSNQVKYYLKEKVSDEGVVLPSVVQTAVNNYLTPILTRYENDYMDRELLFSLLSKNGLTFANSELNKRYELMLFINKSQFNEYLLSTGNEGYGVYDLNYASLYADWFEILSR
ncbi:MAG: hypothetical protein LBV58_02095 [Acholeplasmatales bacterium]|jgi:hypothetical protein|nr:hypothetical protein [Acholeplasmatales bacterium]